jgi:SIT4-associating protein SAP185/190
VVNLGGSDGEPTTFKEFWEFLRRPPPLDNTTAGYFTKINETLLDKKQKKCWNFSGL